MHWLESGHGTYWISGKAGSGKSTLMNFISQDPRTNAALRVWSGTSEVLLPKFFFWNAGTDLQKSSRGLLRSIIYQIMEKTPELMPVLEGYINTAQQRTQQLPTWTERRLLATLQHLLRYGLQSYRLCIFVDGLDEFSGHQDDLLELTRDFQRYSNIKICLSSRPYRIFRDEFGSSAMLKLQELTEPDIREYVSNKLERACWETSQVPESSLMVDEVVDGIVRRAEGVFLWVKLAVRDQREGIRNCDDAKQLLERLHTLPDEIEGVYLHMLQRIDKVYWKEAAQYFHLVLNFGDSSLLNIALAGYNQIDNVLVFSPDTSLSDISRHCRLTRERIATTCQGILEVRETDRQECQNYTYPPSKDSCKSLADQNRTPELRNDLIELKSYENCSRVAFLHRTALEFFKDNGQARKFMEASISVSPHLQLLYIKALLANLVVLPLSTDDEKVRESIERILRHAAIAEDKTRLAQPALMGLIDRIVSNLCQRSRVHPLDIHWCRAWGYPATFNRRKDAGILKIIPKDFLGFAASFGLDLYVVYTVDSQSGRRTCSTADYLLGCVLRGLFEHFSGYSNIYSLPVSGHLRLITALLERGANPQTKFPEGTAWGFFLLKIYGQCCYRDIRTIAPQTDWDSTFRAFLASGANPNEMIRIRIGGGLFLYPADAAILEGFEVVGYEFWLDVSPLTVLRLCFDKYPRISQVEDSFIAIDASVCSECKWISVTTRDKGGQDRRLDLKLSQQQGDDCMEALKRRPNDENWTRILRHFGKLVQELDLQQLYDQVRQKEALQENIIQEEELGENGVNTDIGNISDRWTIVIPDSSDSGTEETSQSPESSQTLVWRLGPSHHVTTTEED